MIGGATAIIFSISIFLLQGVADLYSSRYFEEYATRGQQVIYMMVIAIVLGLFGMALYTAVLADVRRDTGFAVILISLSLIGIVFALIDWQFEMVRARVTPANAVSFLERKALAFVRELQRTAETLATIVALHTGQSQSVVLPAAYQGYMQPFLAQLDKQIETLIELSMKLADRKEVETTKLAIAAATRVLDAYLDGRKASSVILLSDVALLAFESDSQGFLAQNFERLNRAGKKFIEDGRDELSTYILTLTGCWPARPRMSSSSERHQGKSDS